MGIFSSRGRTISGISAKIEIWSSPKPNGGVGVLDTGSERLEIMQKIGTDTYGLYWFRYRIFTLEV